MNNQQIGGNSQDRPKAFDPYEADAGIELERLIHKDLFGIEDDRVVPAYSRDDGEGEKVAAELQRKYGRALIFRTTRTRPIKYFVKLENSRLEVSANYEALAVCRLAAVLVIRDRK